MNRGTRPQTAKTAAIPGLAAEHWWIADVCTAPGGLYQASVESITIAIRAFSRRFYPKRLTSDNTHIDKPTAESTMQGDSQLDRSS